MKCDEATRDFLTASVCLSGATVPPVVTVIMTGEQRRKSGDVSVSDKVEKPCRKTERSPPSDVSPVHASLIVIWPPSWFTYSQFPSKGGWTTQFILLVSASASAPDSRLTQLEISWWRKEPKRQIFLSESKPELVFPQVDRNTSCDETRRVFLSSCSTERSQFISADLISGWGHAAARRALQPDNRISIKATLISWSWYNLSLPTLSNKELNNERWLGVRSLQPEGFSLCRWKDVRRKEEIDETMKAFVLRVNVWSH